MQNTAAAAINWQNASISEFTANGPVLEVKDDATTYCATVEPANGESIHDAAREMCREFARTYDFNGERDCDIACHATIYVDGGDSWNQDGGWDFRVVQREDGKSGYASF